MYEAIIKEYIKKIKISDVINFASKNNINLKPNEDKIIYEFIINNWYKIYNKDESPFYLLKNKLSDETYSNIIQLYKLYKQRYF